MFSPTKIVFIFTYLSYCVLFSQIQEKEMLIFNFSKIQGTCYEYNYQYSEEEVCFIQPEVTFIEYKPYWSMRKNIANISKLGVYSFFSPSDSFNIIAQKERKTLAIFKLLEYQYKMDSKPPNVRYFKLNKYLKKRLLDKFTFGHPNWAKNMFYVSVFKAKISYLNVGKTEVCVPNFDYSYCKRKKDSPIKCVKTVAYEIVSVDYIRPLVFSDFLVVAR